MRRKNPIIFSLFNKPAPRHRLAEKKFLMDELCLEFSHITLNRSQSGKTTFEI